MMQTLCKDTSWISKSVAKLKLKIEDAKNECVPQTGKYEKIMNMIFIKIVLFLIKKKHYEDMFISRSGITKSIFNFFIVKLTGIFIWYDRDMIYTIKSQI